MFYPKFIVTELDTSRWGDCEILDDINEGKFVINERVFMRKYNGNDEDEDEDNISSVSSTDSGEWINIEKKEKNYKSFKENKEESKETSRGIIQNWNSDKGYGFVSLDSTTQNLSAYVKKSAKNSVFLHMSQLNTKVAQKIKKGYAIEYVLIYDKNLKKPQAFKAKLMKKNK